MAKLDEADRLDWSRVSVDGSTVEALRRRGARALAPRHQGKTCHLAVDASGLPLDVLHSPGNHNEERYLIALLDELAKHGIVPTSSGPTAATTSTRDQADLAARGIRSQIRQPGRLGRPISGGIPTRVVYRGKKRVVKTADAHARRRRLVERCIAWLKSSPLRGQP